MNCKKNASFIYKGDYNKNVNIAVNLASGVIAGIVLYIGISPSAQNTEK